MLEGASDYHFQPTGDYDVTGTPSFADGGTGPFPLRYRDILYLGEAGKCASAAGFSKGFSWTGGTDQRIPLSVCRGLLAAISSFSEGNTYSQSLAFNRYDVQPNAVFPEGARGDRLHLISSVASDVLDMGAYKYVAPTAAEKMLDLSHLRRAWSSLSAFRRCYYNGVTLSSGGIQISRTISRTIVSTDGDTSNTTRYEDEASGSSSYWGEAVFGKYTLETDKTETRIELAVSCHVTAWDWLPSITVNGVICSVYGHVSNGDGTSSDPPLLWTYRPISGITAKEPDFSFSISSDEAKAFGVTLGTDSSNGGGHNTTITPKYLDLTLNFKHLI